MLRTGDVAIRDGVVDAVGLPPAPGGAIAAPGLVDLQVNGFSGIDLMGADEQAVQAVGRALVRHGVTSYLPTIITADAGRTERALSTLRRAVDTPDAAGARPLGVHLEGPFLSARRLGTHPPMHRRDPDPVLLQRWLEAGPVVAVTLAPELPGALNLVTRLTGDGILVSVGHSDATAAQAHAAFDAGARTVTHLFNAMSPLNHRAAGIPGVALSRDDVVVQLLVDGHHLARDVVRMVWRAAAGRVVLVTDATAAAGLAQESGNGRYALGDVDLELRDGAVRNADGQLAGSAATLDAALREAHAIGIPLDAALVAVTEAPAALVRRRDIGRLLPGAPGDVVVLDDALVVRATYREGAEVWS
ncbi:MAG: N-acetylglucosamine-6-phosphate deacetylase [Actinomycetota bacterium]|nr:N-acetylglucosamine-6-phosphate deacetylase [Actinomycetota bacterium]